MNEPLLTPEREPNMYTMEDWVDKINAHAERAAEEKKGDQAERACQAHLIVDAITCKEAAGLTVANIRYVPFHGQVVIVFTNGKYLYLRANGGGCGIGINEGWLEDSHDLELEQAYEFGLLPDALYAPVQKAREANQEFSQHRGACARLREAAKELGPNVARELLDDM